jgi:hypothetical protein
MTKSEIMFFKALTAIVALFASICVGLAAWQLKQTINLIEQVSSITTYIKQIKQANYARVDDLLVVNRHIERIDKKVEANRSCVTELQIKFSSAHPNK